jgi:N-acyl-D-aspartate/D-glutamate deacylase
MERITVSGISSVQNEGLVGNTIAEIAADRNIDPAEAAVDLLLEEEGSVNVVSLDQSEENLQQIIYASTVFDYQLRLLRKRQSASAIVWNVSGTARRRNL